MFRYIKKRLSRRQTIGQNVTHGDGFSFGRDSYVWAPTGITFGNNVSLGSYVRIEADGKVGDNVLIANSAAIVGRSDHQSDQVGVPINESRWVGKYPNELSHRTVIGSDVWIGFGAIVVSGVTIGDSSIIGAGSVVTKSIPANSVAAGNPAKVIRERFDKQSFDDHWKILTRSGVRRIAESS